MAINQSKHDSGTLETSFDAIRVVEAGSINVIIRKPGQTIGDAMQAHREASR